MLSRLRPSTRRRFGVPDEDRQTFLVNAAFVLIIALSVLLLAGIFGWSYYVDNLRPVASVGGVEIRPDMVQDRLELGSLRISREQRRLRQAFINNQIDSTTYEERRSELDAELAELQAAAEENLIDLLLQERLAAERGISVTAADVDARMAQQLAGPEQRRVQMIVIEPDAEDPDALSYGEREAARLRAEEALRELQAGASFADVAREYSTDQSAAPDGELGLITTANPVDATFRREIFELAEDETTDVIRGRDGAYRIGRVTEIVAGAEDRGFLDRILERMSLERYRQFLAWEVTADRLQEEVTQELLGNQIEQLRLSHIRIDGSETVEGEEEEGEVRYSEILVAPDDSPDEAPELPEDDPAWEAAREEAEQIVDELEAIADTQERLERFRTLAQEESDSGSAEDGGEIDFSGRELLPLEVGDALFAEDVAADELLGPIRDENGYYVLWFHERRGPASERLAELKAALEQPDPNWAELVQKYSDDELSRDEEGDIGWWTPTMLNQVDSELDDKLFALAEGTISEPIELDEQTHVFLIAEKEQRAVDADQMLFLREDAFNQWYSDKKEAAEESGVIVRADAELEGDDPGLDFPQDGDIEQP